MVEGFIRSIDKASPHPRASIIHKILYKNDEAVRSTNETRHIID